jgi:hypothetical protein
MNAMSFESRFTIITTEVGSLTFTSAARALMLARAPDRPAQTTAATMKR